MKYNQKSNLRQTNTLEQAVIGFGGTHDLSNLNSLYVKNIDLKKFKATQVEQFFAPDLRHGPRLATVLTRECSPVNALFEDLGADPSVLTGDSECSKSPFDRRASWYREVEESELAGAESGFLLQLVPFNYLDDGQLQNQYNWNEIPKITKIVVWSVVLEATYGFDIYYSNGYVHKGSDDAPSGAIVENWEATFGPGEYITKIRTRATAAAGVKWLSICSNLDRCQATPAPEPLIKEWVVDMPEGARVVSLGGWKNTHKITGVSAMYVNSGDFTEEQIAAYNSQV